MTMRIALLRGVNVGGNKKVAMADLKAMIGALGFTEVKTLLQSGNVVFRAGDESDAALETLLEAETEKRLGLATRYLVRGPAEWRAIIAANPFPDEAVREPSRLLVNVLREPPSKAALDAIQAAATPGEKVGVVGRVVYIYFGDGIADSKAALVFGRKTLGMIATGRNWNTVRKLAELVGV